MNIVLRAAKALGLGAIMYFSLKYLGFDKSTSFILALIPVVLGAFGVLVQFAFTIAALTFVVAAFSSALPSEYGNALTFAKSFVADQMADRQSKTQDANADKHEGSTVKAR